jgi:hypothetical protein
MLLSSFAYQNRKVKAKRLKLIKKGILFVYIYSFLIKKKSKERNEKADKNTNVHF